jgi:2-polyprenyl-3-methyl-5-hydroxy-6-metoxy-1,4-benzoquinol methylase
MTLTDASFWQEHWDSEASRHGFLYLDDIAPFLPRGDNLRLLEIGCAPGGILAHICGARGYEANGLDFVCDPTQMEQQLRARGVRVGQVHRADFLNWHPSQRYDIVSSFGFIEHFDDPGALARRHFELVAPGGTVVIGIPNFARGQRVLHQVFDRPQLLRHNTSCMSLRFLRQVAADCSAEVLFASYVGGHFAFWPGHDERPRYLELAMRRTVRFIQRVARRVPSGTNSLLSPYLVGVFKASS